MNCAGQTLLLARSRTSLVTALGRYSSNYDEVLIEIHRRLRRNGHATKFDLAGLIGWKHVQNASWMSKLYDLAPGVVEAATAAAFRPRLTDVQRIAALGGLPGYGAGRAFTSVLLTAWDPTSFGVFDKFVDETRSKITSARCRCRWDDLPTYFDHMRQLAVELSTTTGRPWTPREVDKAMYILGGGK
jgi:hypothetical protein